MAGNRVVAHYRDGRLVKGSTTDFLPTRETLHIHTEVAVETVRLAELKALFFVRDLAGDPQHKDRNEFDVNRSLHGRRFRVEFTDGEVLIGTTQGYQPERAGFFAFEQGVERIFPLHSPTIAKIEVSRAARVRRAKLYYLRDLKGKAARMREHKRPA